MTRPPFKLADDEARALISRLQAIEAEYPLDQRDHRPFVRAFVRAVHEATGRTFSPVIYRRLLAAYAPQRRPSTATLAIEKLLLADELELERGGAAEVAATEAPHLAALIRRAVSDAVGERPLHALFPSGSSPGPDIAFWRERVADAERAVAGAQAQVAHLAGELLAARTSASILSAELASVQEMLQSQAVSVGKLATELEESRRFSMRAIDDARGETRAWRDRCQVIEAQAAAKAREDNILLETFRQLAYQRGAAIPPTLQKGGK
jgi:hypothetical protein